MDMSKAEFLEQGGVYELDGIIWTHLSPIPNWHYILKGLEFVCPFCDQKRKFEYQKDNAEYSHRAVVFICGCEQKFGIENYDKYRGEK